MKRIFVLFFVLFPSLVFAITFTVGNYRYSADTAAYGSSVLEQAKKAFSLQHIILSDDNKPEANLGYGFSTDRGTPVSPCIVDGGIEYGGTDKGFVEADLNYSLDQVKKQLHLSLESDVDLGFFSDDVSADFVHNLEHDEFSESFIYRSRIQLKNSIYKDLQQPEILNRKGRAYQNDPDMFRFFCGDKYVDQMEWGGYLYIAVKFVFTNDIDEQAFNAAMDMKFDNIVHISGKLSQAVSVINKKGAIKLTALQIGGDPTKLGKILGGEGGKAPIVYCTFDDLDKCHQMLDNVIAYATLPEDDNFPTQIKIGGPEIPVSAAPTALDLEEYSSLGIKIHAPSALTKEMKIARNDLAAALAHIKADEDRSKFLMGRFAYVTDYVTKLQDTLKALQQNESMVTDAGMSCFTDLPNCVETAKKTLADLKPVNRNLLQQPFEQDVRVGLNGTVDCVHQENWECKQWATLAPTTAVDLRIGAIQQTNYSSFSISGDKLASVPPCSDTFVDLVNKSYFSEKGNRCQESSALSKCMFYLTTIEGTGAIQQYPNCSNGYTTVFGGLDQGQKTIKTRSEGEYPFWHDKYDMVFRVMHYYE